MQSVMDHPDNPSSLRAMADGTWPDAATAHLDLVEPLLARTGLKNALLQSASAVVAAAPSVGPTRVGAASCTPGAIGSDAGLLDACMDVAASAAFELAGASGKVLNDLSRAIGQQTTSKTAHNSITISVFI